MTHCTEEQREERGPPTPPHAQHWKGRPTNKVLDVRVIETVAEKPFFTSTLLLLDLSSINRRILVNQKASGTHTRAFLHEHTPTLKPAVAGISRAHNRSPFWGVIRMA